MIQTLLLSSTAIEHAGSTLEVLLFSNDKIKTPATDNRSSRGLNRFSKKPKTQNNRFIYSVIFDCTEPAYYKFIV